MTLPIRKPAKEFSPDGILADTEAPRSRFQESENDPEFWKAYFRYPRHDLAEAVVSIRRLRGLTQAELADLVGTKQPAIARIESARANVGLDTVRELCIALDAVVRVSMQPAEELQASRLLAAGTTTIRSGCSSRTVSISIGETMLSFLGESSVLESRVEPPTETNRNFSLSA